MALTLPEICELTTEDDLLAREHHSLYHFAHSAGADLCRRLGRLPEALSYKKALVGRAWRG